MPPFGWPPSESSLANTRRLISSASDELAASSLSPFSSSSTGVANGSGTSSRTGTGKRTPAAVTNGVHHDVDVHINAKLPKELLLRYPPNLELLRNCPLQMQFLFPLSSIARSLLWFRLRICCFRALVISVSNQYTFY